MKKLSFLLTLLFIWTCSSPTKSKPAPQPPTVNNLSIITNEDTPATFTMTGSDPEGAALTFSISTQPTNGTVTISGAAGTYTPKENYHGQDTFAYIASDGTLSSTAGLVSVTITAVDDDPNTMDVTATTDEDTSVTITLEAEEVDGDNITFQLKTNPLNGSVTISGNQATYTPNENYYGSDSFTFEAVDSSAKRMVNVATASITINPVNDAPMVNPSEAEAYDNAGINLDIEVTDVDDENITLQIVDQPKNVSASINGLTLEVDNPKLYWGTDELTISAYDGTDFSETVTISLGFKRNINYNVPSHDFENYVMPWFDLHSIVTELGFDKTLHNNTGSAYADFNGDNYFDISFTPAVGDGNTTKEYFFINRGDNSFYIDENFPINNYPFMQARKTIVGDFNLDGKPDIVRPHGAHGFYEHPTITLSKEVGYEVILLDNGPLYHYHTVSSGDIDNDGDLDLFFAENQDYDGFMINDGNANFSWRGINEVISGVENPRGIYTSDMTDIDQDGNIDLIVGGNYRRGNHNPGNFLGPIVFWGNGNGQFSRENTSLVFDVNEIDYETIVVTHDFSVDDIDGDGFKDIALQSGLAHDDPINAYQIVFSNGDRQFEDKTEELMEDFIVNGPGQVWILLRDVDNNGFIDLIEGEPILDMNGPNAKRDSFWWEWTGSSFIRRQ